MYDTYLKNTLPKNSSGKKVVASNLYWLDTAYWLASITRVTPAFTRHYLLYCIPASWYTIQHGNNSSKRTLVSECSGSLGFLSFLFLFYFQGAGCSYDKPINSSNYIIILNTARIDAIASAGLEIKEFFQPLFFRRCTKVAADPKTGASQ
jgi:hypothetical protein